MYRVFGEFKPRRLIYIGSIIALAAVLVYFSVPPRGPTGFWKLVGSYYATLIFIVNPFGSLPIYLDIVEPLSRSDRRRFASFVATIVLGLLVFMAVAGRYIFVVYKISISEFRLGGGIALLAIAIRRLEGYSITQTPDPKDAAITPLAMPLLVGPATIAYVTLTAAEGHIFALLLASAGVSVTVWILLLASEHIIEILGRSTMKILTRVSALFVAGVGSSMIHQTLIDWGFVES